VSCLIEFGFGGGLESLLDLAIELTTFCRLIQHQAG